MLTNALPARQPSPLGPAAPSLRAVGDLFRPSGGSLPNVTIPNCPALPDWDQQRPYLTGQYLLESLEVEDASTSRQQPLESFSSAVQEIVGVVQHWLCCTSYATLTMLHWLCYTSFAVPALLNSLFYICCNPILCLGPDMSTLAVSPSCASVSTCLKNVKHVTCQIWFWLHLYALNKCTHHVPESLRR